MKRASLSVRPPTAKTEPADLTDRLLDREAGVERPAAAPASALAAKPARKRTKRSTSAAPSEPTPPPPVIVASTNDEVASLDAVLAQATGAVEALETAARQAPARYEVALRYRLDALAHHLRQVSDFVTNLARR